MFRNLFIIVSLIFLSSCSPGMVPCPVTERPLKPLYNERVRVFENTDDVAQLIWSYATELKYEKRLRLEHSCVIAGEDYSKIRIQFSSQDILELCEARQLLVDVVEGLLARVNESDVGLELEPYPLSADYLEIYIDFQSFYGEYLDPFYIGWVALEDGFSYFYAFDLKNKKLDTWSTHYEPYFQSRSFALFQRAAEEQYKQAHPKNKPSVLSRERYHPL